MNIKYDENTLEEICKSNDIKSVAVFGSYARGEETSKSDIDLLIDYDKPKSLLTLGGILSDLEEVFGKKIDMVKKSNVKPILLPYINRDVVTLYEKN